MLQDIFNQTLLDILIDDIKVIARNAKTEIKFKQINKDL